MNPLLPLLPLPRTGSSGAGISYYTKVIRCPRKARLDKEHSEQEKADGAAALGTVLHQMDELYYGGITDNPAALQISDVNWGDTITEARRCWAAYVAKFPGPDFWGEVIGTEMLFPQHYGQDPVVEAVIGSLPFTIRIDRVVRVTPESAKRIANATPDLGVLTPGVYLMDRKTKGKQDGDAALMHMYSLQFASYLMIYNALHTEKALGMIVDELITTKEVKFRQFLVTPPDEQQQAVIRSMVANAKALEKTDAALGVSFACKEYNRFCPHLLTGNCKRF